MGGGGEGGGSEICSVVLKLPPELLKLVLQHTSKDHGCEILTSHCLIHLPGGLLGGGGLGFHHLNFIQSLK